VIETWKLRTERRGATVLNKDQKERGRGERETSLTLGKNAPELAHWAGGARQ